jgi:hypothetical protein
MLGITPGLKRGQWGYRNWYLVGAAGLDYESMIRMESFGFVFRRNVVSRSTYFHATEDGCRLVGLRPRQIVNAMGGLRGYKTKKENLQT